MCLLVFLIAFVPMNFVSIWLFKVSKVNYVLVVAGLVTIAGSWLRMLMFTSDQFWICLLMTLPVAAA